MPGPPPSRSTSRPESSPSAGRPAARTTARAFATAFAAYPAPAVLLVRRMGEDTSVDDANAHRGAAPGERQLAERAGRAQTLERQSECDIAARDRRRARPAIGLEDVAVDQDRALSEGCHI